jgi:hypothetical protein
MLREYEDKMFRSYEDKSGGDTFVVIASGPSLTQEQVDYCRGKAKVIVINDNYMRAPWADYLYFCDDKWFKWHKDKDEFKRFKGRKFAQYQIGKGHDRNREKLTEIYNGYNVELIGSKPESGLSIDPDVIHTGSNSGYQAINLAYHLGAKRIILIGYDMQLTNGQAHWFGDHPDNIRSSYDSFKKFYNHMAPHAEELGIEIINCTKKTALTCFSRQKLEEVL